MKIFSRLLEKLRKIFLDDYYVIVCRQVNCLNPAVYVLIPKPGDKSNDNIHTCKEHLFDLIRSENDKIKKIDNPETGLKIKSYFDS